MVSDTGLPSSRATSVWTTMVVRPTWIGMATMSTVPPVTGFVADLGRCVQGRGDGRLA